MDSNNTEFCAKCQVFYSRDKKVEHCNMCNVCVEKMDHHCVWVGKCVGKNNIFSFYSMLTSIGIVYGFIIYLAFFQYSNKVSKKIKTK
jgi:predicted amidophosphoribosyltransferase